MTTRVLVLVGSLRADSLNRKLAQTLLDQSPAGVELILAEDLDRLPFYNEDLDGPQAPEPVRELRAAVAAADRLLVVTPEYNGSMPAVLKNAIDWLSRPRLAGALQGKPIAVVGATPTPYGGTWAHQDTLRTARIAGAVPMEELTLSQSALGVDVLTDPTVRSLLHRTLTGLVAAQPVAA